MKKTIFVLLFLSISAFAQLSEQSLNTVSKFGMAGGVSFNYLFPNISPLNSELKKSNMPEFPTSLITFGGSGYVYVLFVRNLRLGGFGYGGSEEVSKQNRSSRLSISGGGITIEYTLPQIKGIAVSLGSVIGGGKINCDLFEFNENLTWVGIWDEFNGNSRVKHLNFYKTYFLLMPTVNAEILLNRFIAFRIGAGYQIPLFGNWKTNDNIELSGVPNDLTSRGFVFTTGLLIGLFVF